MIQITNKSECCGCTACENICPHQAIIMRTDVMGFLYPEVNPKQCTDCGLCEKVCAFNEHYAKNDNIIIPQAYAVRHKNIKEIRTSRSGGAFIAFSNWILQQGGVVYGAGYTDHFRVVHKRAVTIEERNEFKGSKYVQSDLNTTFSKINTDLSNGLKVLFSGTPCQTSGLHSFLRLKKVDCTWLYLCDIVCHGVPGPFIWRDYIKYIEKEEKRNITTVNFRDKSKLGWESHVESFSFPNKYITRSLYTDIFYKHIAFRHSCSSCHFTNLQRPSDITLADFWGWEKAIDTAFNVDNNGCSLILVNTQKGINWFDEIKEETNYIPVELQNCLQPNLEHPSVPHYKRELFEADYSTYGFEYVMKRYGSLGWSNRIRNIARKVKMKFKKR